MTYSYNRLWKLLIDKRMTKTDMRKAAGISTNILAKMVKDEPVAMDTLAKIATDNRYYSSGQHRGNVGEGQLWLKDTNIADFDEYEVGVRDILAKIVEKSGRK